MLVCEFAVPEEQPHVRVLVEHHIEAQVHGYLKENGRQVDVFTDLEVKSGIYEVMLVFNLKFSHLHVSIDLNMFFFTFIFGQLFFFNHNQEKHTHNSQNTDLKTFMT